MISRIELIIKRVSNVYKNNLSSYYTYLTKNHNRINNFSYYKFLVDNPTASKIEKRNAIKKFLDATR